MTAQAASAAVDGASRTTCWDSGGKDTGYRERISQAARGGSEVAREPTRLGRGSWPGPAACRPREGPENAI